MVWVVVVAVVGIAAVGIAVVAFIVVDLVIIVFVGDTKVVQPLSHSAHCHCQDKGYLNQIVVSRCQH
jgi:hypothetical protein